MNELPTKKKSIDFFKSNKINRFFKAGSVITLNGAENKILGLEAFPLPDPDIMPIAEVVRVADWSNMRRFNKCKWLKSIGRSNGTKPIVYHSKPSLRLKIDSIRENLTVKNNDILTVLGKPRKVFHNGTSWFLGHALMPKARKNGYKGKPMSYVVPVLFGDRKYLIVLPVKKDPRLLFRKIF